jgi:hypothetical protein
MIPVLPGQIWSIRDARSPRYDIRVDRICGRDVICTVVATGRTKILSLSVLSTGKRAARLAGTSGKPKTRAPEIKVRRAREMLAEGKTRAEVADFFGVLEKTVKRWMNG